MTTLQRQLLIGNDRGEDCRHLCEAARNDGKENQEGQMATERRRATLMLRDVKADTVSLETQAGEVGSTTGGHGD